MFELDTFQKMLVEVQGSAQKQPRMRVTAMPAKHVATKPLQKLNELVQAVSIDPPPLSEKISLLLYF